eukprot:TRINITY_DN3490_c0_g2_i1.p1 TRINITY_DN3490_c0_g2~~TRINITY_DN3490_c0_g2_i1.p1  ORF type:complete len:203 (+),score=63.23 TRINITY_DN3490_c0_g2_i1:51-659(+)
MSFTLVSSDGKNFSVELSVLQVSDVLKQMMDEEDVELNEIPIQGVHSKELEKVLEYCKEYSDLAKQFEGLEITDESKNQVQENWFTKFSTMSPADIEQLWNAANFLNILDLMNLTADFVIKEYIEDKPIEQIRHTFGIVNDFTPEEEEEIRKQNDDWFFTEDRLQREEEEAERQKKLKEEEENKKKQEEEQVVEEDAQEDIE